MAHPSDASFRFGKLPPELAAHAWGFAGPEDRNSASQASSVLKASVADYSVSHYQGSSLEEEIPPFDGQVEDPEWLQKQREDQMAKVRALKRRVLDMPGGDYDMGRATKHGAVSAFDPEAVTEMARTVQNIRGTGMAALIMQVNGGREFLESIRGVLSDRQRNELMKNWLAEHASDLAAVQSVELPRVQQHTFGDLHRTKPCLGTKVMRRLPSDALVQFDQLRHLRVQNNLLDKLPDNIGQLPCESLDISRNHLREVPPGIAQLAGSLKHLDISCNFGPQLDFGDDCPIWKAGLLESLDLSSDGMVNLSSKVADLRRLKYLYLSGNQLKSLPESLPQLESLRVLRLDGNAFSGLPQVLEDMPQLEQLFLVNLPGVLTGDIFCLLMSLVEKRSKNLKIHIDARHADPYLFDWINESNLRNSCKIAVQKLGVQLILTLQTPDDAPLEATQEID